MVAAKPHTMPEGLPFTLNYPAIFFEKSGAPLGKRRRVGGIVSTETRDKEGEVILQRGLDFSPYEKDGWINDNHCMDTDGVIGFPDGPVQKFRKGEELPNGQPAPENCSYHEGFMLEGDDRADRLWKKAQSLKGTGRSLGWSIQGRALRRQGENNKTVAAALVKHVALTAVAVNTETQLDILSKSMKLAETATDEVWTDTLNKALTMGTPASPGNPPVGPKTGTDAGQVITPESLEHDAKNQSYGKKKKKKKFSKAEAIGYVLDKFPKATCETAGRIVDLTLARMERDA